MNSPAAGMWDCEHGADGRDYCPQCHGSSEPEPDEDDASNLARAIVRRAYHRQAKPLKHPEIDKVIEVRDQAQVIGKFLEWMDRQGILRMQWDSKLKYPYKDRRSIDELVADYFEINTNKLKKEEQVLRETARQWAKEHGYTPRRRS